MEKSLPAFVAAVLTLIAFVPYGRAILNGSTKPHVFSWVIWGLVTVLAFLAQLAKGGGLGAWVVGLSGVLSVTIAIVAWAKRADVGITRIDWCFLACALLSLPCWFFTRDALWAVVVLTMVDVLGFGPTVGKVWRRPHSESLGFFALFFARNLFVIGALENYSLATVLFPAAIGAVCLVVMTLIVVRRRQLRPVTASPAER